MKQLDFTNSLNLKSILKSALAAILTLALELLIVTFIIQLISGFYQVAVNHQLNVFDLTILSTFTGAVCGVIISKAMSIYRFFRRLFDHSKKGGSDER